MTPIGEAIISYVDTQADAEIANNKVDGSVDQRKSVCEYYPCFENDCLKERSAADDIWIVK